MSQSACSILSCSEAAAGLSPRNARPLCRLHLDEDVAKVHKLTLKVNAKASPFLKQLEAWRLEQQTLEAELASVEEVFNAVEATVAKWKAEMLGRLTRKHEIVRQCVRDCADLAKYGEKLTRVGDQDAKEAFETATWMELLLERLLRDCGIDVNSTAYLSTERKNSPTLSPPSAVRSLRDVSGGVRELQCVIDRHMSTFVDVCSEDSHQQQLRQKRRQSTADCQELATSVIDCVGQITHLAVCVNTAGYAIDSAVQPKIVRRGEADEEGEASNGEGELDSGGVVGKLRCLPQPCVFAALHAKSERRRHLLAVSLDSSVGCRLRLRWQCDEALGRGEERTVGLHCDSRRQLLYIARPSVVTVADLAGVAVASFASETVGAACKFEGLDGDADTLVTIDRNSRRVLTFGKETLRLASKIDISWWSPATCQPSTFIRCVGNGSHLLLPDCRLGCVRKLCRVSGQLLLTACSSSPAWPKFKTPSGAAVDNRGVAYVADSGSHCVLGLLSNGSVLMRLGKRGSAGRGSSKLNCPTAVEVVEESDGDCRRLVVADRHNERLLVVNLS